ncbi:hypothetical protein Nther_2356 [Natranaerobius thermophilus JW/NM-WN-LF]|uniref:Uncharacterized protein n=1 Tax=Natranaerobius thermophilus (strain ATCC BAA-1301 / DSM 18059 / JW/NM-WN-LF) TaxID=457570 RepID=B2A0P1_NATTJ|nr:hypothetical protein Nther_2356 [Natranaerobius thermophilus JW/NM-WN-LF]
MNKAIENFTVLTTKYNRAVNKITGKSFIINFMANFC